MNRRSEEPDLEKDKDLVALSKKCKAIGYNYALKPSGLFIAGEKVGMPPDAALDSFHLHLYKNDDGEIVGLATYVGKDMDEKQRKSLAPKDAGKKLHTPISNFGDPPAEIPEPLKEVAAFVEGALIELNK